MSEAPDALEAFCAEPLAPLPLWREPRNLVDFAVLRRAAAEMATFNWDRAKEPSNPGGLRKTLTVPCKCGCGETVRIPKGKVGRPTAFVNHSHFLAHRQAKQSTPRALAARREAYARAAQS